MYFLILTPPKIIGVFRPADSATSRKAGSTAYIVTTATSAVHEIATMFLTARPVRTEWEDPSGRSTSSPGFAASGTSDAGIQRILSLHSLFGRDFGKRSSGCSESSRLPDLIEPLSRAQ